MSLPISRVNDLCSGVCQIHGPMLGIIITGNPTLIIGNSPASYLNMIVQGFCGHVGYLDSPSITYINNKIPGVRITSHFSGVYSGTVVQGEPTALTK